MILSQRVRKGRDSPFFPRLTYLHTQKLADSSPVVFAKKNLISREIRFFSLLFAYLQCPDFLVFLIDHRNTTDRKTPASAGVSFFAFMAAIRTLSFSSHSSGVWL